MLRFTSYDIVFQEIPDEVTLAINISNCPNRCKGCHSPWLMENTGEVLNDGTLSEILAKYKGLVTCVCFMGGDTDPVEVDRLANLIRKKTNGKLKTAWYSGKKDFPEQCSLQNFDYIKLGPYIENLGGLSSPATNQRFYRIEENKPVDITCCFQKDRLRKIKTG